MNFYVSPFGNCKNREQIIENVEGIHSFLVQLSICSKEKKKKVMQGGKHLTFSEHFRRFRVALGNSQ